MTTPTSQNWPQIRTVGINGMLVSFADALSEPSNRAALAFRARLEREGWDGVIETSSTLASAFVRFDPFVLSHSELHTRLKTLLSEANWFDAAPPEGRRFWRIPAVYGGPLAPQLDEAAKAAGMSATEAVTSLSASRVRVTTLGFAAGQPYLGELPEAWNLPRQSGLTPKVPVGALVVAIRQFVLFATSAPTGWRHVAQTAFTCFRPESDTPFALRAGDEVQFVSISREEFEAIRTRDKSGDGGATVEPIK
ncbi:allophanate hydrolase subunit 1 [Cognatishimia sp. MH4019]|uniref:5-oxoprolinase subunit B family protein n=1 Tax=Cognatishimia sp. MH4019 TaxID=2854030 RepID=UPI001CD725D3|nr:allophanate hydrolase subunit 1 [Cognatishimia sp. MH4019]